MAVGKWSISSFQAAVSLLAGLASLSGAAYSAVRFVSPTSRAGEVLAVVRVGETDKRVAGATIEILSGEDAVVATLTGDAEGTVRRTLPEGAYRLRATAPRFEPQMRAVEVHREGLAEVRFALAPHED